MTRAALVVMAVWASAFGQGAPEDGLTLQNPCRADSLPLVRTLTASPRVRQRLGREVFPEATVHALDFSATAAARIVASLSWGGPSNGALVILTCAGDVLDVAQVGYVHELRRMTLPGRRAVYVLHQTGVGTGWKQDSFTLYGFDEDSLSVLWTGVASEDSYQAAETGAYEIRASVRLLDGGRRLLRVATRYPLAFDQSQRRWSRIEGRARVLREEYSWDNASARFVRRR